jgi:double-strand break repair protein MRE11
MKQHCAENDDNTFRILVATDNHLGFMERDPIRGNDSFITFEEILQHAKKLKVDFILLGGDLFHDNKPSKRTLHRTIELIRTYCFGDDPIKVQILSDQKINFPNKFGHVNYEDPNFNISIPIFSIHGNHDDPGQGGLAALDILHAANFVNYFGKNSDIMDIKVYPILMSKGKTKVALYGLGNIRDERLYNTFAQGKVKFMRPSESTEEWFNIFILHQNRVAHSLKNYIPEKMIDNFIDLVIWGHEHECKIIPTQSAERDFYIIQPGSSVITSLSEFEAKKKHIGLLEIVGNEFRVTPIPLTTVRPFVLDEVVLSDHLDPSRIDGNDSDPIMEFLSQKVNELIEKISKENDDKTTTCGDAVNIDKRPLVRLKVEYTGFESISPQRFGQRFVNRVANPNEILSLYRKKTVKVRRPPCGPESVSGIDANALHTVAGISKAYAPDEQNMEDLINECLGPNASLYILPHNDLNEVLHQFVEKNDIHAITDFVSKALSKTQEFLLGQDLSKLEKLEDIQALLQKNESRNKIIQTVYRDVIGNSNDNNNNSNSNINNKHNHNTINSNNNTNDKFQSAEYETRPFGSAPTKTTRKRSLVQLLGACRKKKKHNAIDLCVFTNVVHIHPLWLIFSLL